MSVSPTDVRSTFEYDGGNVRFELVDNFRASERNPLMLTLLGSCKIFKK